jgi:6-phosphogluconate dehydrogenase
MTADIGLIGLAVMGQNLVLNMNDNGATVAVYNRTTSKVDDFLAGTAHGTNVIGTHTIEEFVGQLSSPRKAMIMVKAGWPVDAVIEQLVKLFEPGDIIIDGGNSHFEDTERRSNDLAGRGILFIGTGISGGEEGARFGPSIMPGGNKDAWPHVKELFQAIAAKVEDGTPCCDWVGEGGAGHYVKMVHNGIEYGDMQVIAEAYWILKAQGKSHVEMSEIFGTWGEGVLDSFLIDITSDIMKFKDEDGSPLLESILDAAGQKGTGKWTAISSLDLGMPMTLVAEAVYARIVSALKSERVSASDLLEANAAEGAPTASLDDLRDALYASKIISYAQGFMLLDAAAKQYSWTLDYGRIASLWREGCIIRARFLDDITAAYASDPELQNLLFDDFFKDAIQTATPGWRRVVSQAVLHGLPAPAYSSALAFFDGYRSADVSANLVQAQRDYFGAHTYERKDGPRGESFHTDWIGSGGIITAGTYEA